MPLTDQQLLREAKDGLEGTAHLNRLTGIVDLLEWGGSTGRCHRLMALSADRLRRCSKKALILAQASIEIENGICSAMLSAIFL